MTDATPTSSVSDQTANARRDVARRHDDRSAMLGLEPVVLLDWTTRWPVAFRELQDELQRALGSDGHLTSIEHIGSTAVPGLPAKPVIDILIGVRQIDRVVDEWVAPLASHGFRYISRHEEQLPERRFFVRRARGEMLQAHLHIVEPTTEFWRTHLQFRDILRANPTLRNLYAATKIRFAREFRNDRAAYTDAKGPVIRQILATGGDEDALASGDG
ncbi:MAG: GrpB family protein [Planctomycetota bacterium]